MLTFNPTITPRFPKLSYLFSPIIRPRCLVCHRPLRPVFPATPNLCYRCVPPPLLHLDRPNHCPRCGLTLHAATCDRCLLFPLPFASLSAHYHYRGPVRDLLRAMKFTPSRTIALIIARHMAAEIASEPTPTPSWQLVVPIPSGPHSSQKRLFTPAVIAARHIADALHLPLGWGALSAARSRPLQASITSTSKRFHNSHEAFTADHRIVEGKQVLLIDDVITTGGTIAAATAALHMAGAASVAVRAFALADRYERTRPELYRFLYDRSRSTKTAGEGTNPSEPGIQRNRERSDCRENRLGHS